MHVRETYNDYVAAMSSTCQKQNLPSKLTHKLEDQSNLLD